MKYILVINGSTASVDYFLKLIWNPIGARAAVSRTEGVIVLPRGKRNPQKRFIGYIILHLYETVGRPRDLSLSRGNLYI